MFSRLIRSLSLVGILAAAPALAVTSNNFDASGSIFAASSNNGGAVPVGVAGGPQGSFLRLMPDGVGGLDNRVGFNSTDLTGARSISFDYRLPVDPGNARADGFSVSLLNQLTYGNSGAGPVMSETPSNAGALGIGFRIYPVTSTVYTLNNNGTGLATLDTAAVNTNAGVFHRANITLNPTVNGTTLVSMSITPDIFGAPGAPVSIFSNVVVNGSIGGRLAFGGRTGGAVTSVDLDNVVANFDTSLKTTANFDTPGTGYTSGGTSASIVTAGGPTGSFLRILNDSGSTANRVAFDATVDTLNPGGLVHADFDFRVTNGAGPGLADGFSMLLIPTAVHGGFGAGLAVPTAEEPNVAGVIAVGFDFHPGQNDASLHFGSEIINVDVNPAAIDLAAGVFHHAKLVLEDRGAQVLASLILTPNALGVAGAPITAFSNVVIPGLTDLYSYRVEFAGRTGGDTLILDIDNVSVGNVVPEPATAALGLMGLAGLALRRRRVA